MLGWFGFGMALFAAATVLGLCIALTVMWIEEELEDRQRDRVDFEVETLDSWWELAS